MNDSEALDTLRQWHRKGRRLYDECLETRRQILETTSSFAVRVDTLYAILPGISFDKDGAFLVSISNVTSTKKNLGDAVCELREVCGEAFVRQEQLLRRLKALLAAMRTE